MSQPASPATLAANADLAPEKIDAPKDLISSEIFSMKKPTAVDVQSPRKEEVTTATQSADQVEMAYQLFNKYIKCVWEGEFMGKDKSKPVTAKEQADAVEWLKKADFSKMDKNKKANCEKCRDDILEFLAGSPGSGFAHGFAQGEMSQKMRPVLVDFELTGAKAISDGHPELAKDLDMHAKLALIMIMVREGISETETVGRPAVKMFAEYYVTYLGLFSYGYDDKKNKAPTLYQAALLSLNPSDLPDPAGRKLFEELHKSMLKVSELISRGENSRRELARTFITIKTLVSDLKITSSEMEKVSNKNIAAIFGAMIKP